MTHRQPTHDHTVDFFRTLASAKQVTTPEPLKPSHPRLVGLVLGVALGLLYGVISQVINQVLVQGAPLAQSPFGLAGNCLIMIASGAVIGLVVAIPRTFINGVFLGTVVSAAVALLQWWATHAASAAVILGWDSFSPWKIFEMIFYVVVFVPFMLLLRLAVDNQVEYVHKPWWIWARLRVPLLLGVIIGVIGGFSIFPTHVQQALKDMHALIQTGLSASDMADLPPSLAEDHGVTGFRDYSMAYYTLEQSDDFELREDLSTPDEKYTLVIIARFKNNWILACSYDARGNRSRCQSYVTPEFFQKMGGNNGLVFVSQVVMN